MKEIKALIKPIMLNKVVDRLLEFPNLPGFTVSMTHGIGRSSSMSVSLESQVDYGMNLAQIEITVTDALAPLLIEGIIDAAHTGLPGDGKIFISDVADVIKIRSGERGEGAI